MIWHGYSASQPEADHLEVDGVKLDLRGLPRSLKNQIVEEYFELHKRSLAARFLGSDDSVLELGSGIGFVALYCQLQLGIGDYVCVEANRHAIRLAERNHAINGVTPRTIHAAISSENGMISLNAYPDFGITSQKEVPSRTLASIAAVPDFAPTALIVGLGGAEQFVRWKEVPASVRTVLIDLYPHDSDYPVAYDVIVELMAQGFTVTAEEHGTFALTRKQ